MEKWYVVKTQTNAEMKAVFHLNNQGIETFLPVYKKNVSHARQKKTVLKPYFPCYLFVKFNPFKARWRSINGTIGVITLLQNGGMPQSIDEEIIVRIKNELGNREHVNQSIDDFCVGQNVKILEGAFSQFEGIFQEKDDNDRALLLLNFMGRDVHVHASFDNLVAAS